MRAYNICIGEVTDVRTQSKMASFKYSISQQQLDIIQMFASQRKDKDLNTIYKLNECEFTIEPVFSPVENVNNDDEIHVKYDKEINRLNKTIDDIVSANIKLGAELELAKARYEKLLLSTKQITQTPKESTEAFTQ